MRPDQTRAEIARRVAVTRHLVTLAKRFLQNLPGIGPHDPTHLIEGFALKQGYQKPDRFVVHPSVDPKLALEQAAGYFSCALAFAEALYSLIHHDYFLPLGNSQRWSADLRYTTVIPGSGGESGGWQFEEFNLDLPRQVVLAPSCRNERPEPLTDGDLFLIEAGVEGADPEVIDAIHDAVNCFRAELYRPAVTMLGKVAEGAWIELGNALARAIPPDKNFNAQNFQEKMMSDSTSIARKVSLVVDLYQKKELTGQVAQRSGMRPEELQSAVVWSNVVREARNAIHFGTKPTIPNTYEKVAVLFLEAAKLLRTLYRVKAAAEQVAGSHG